MVFYVSDGGLHGLEVTLVDQSTLAGWSNIATTLIGTTGTAIGTGSANTDAIISQSSHSASAAQICRNYRIAEEGDWFLPSQDELDAIWDNLVDDGSGSHSDVGGLAFDYYWSSSESSNNFARTQYFGNGDQYDSFKTDTPRVRAVRSF